MTARKSGERVLTLAACGCVGGFIASTVGAYVGAFPGMDLCVALAATALACLAHARGWATL